MTFSYFFFSFCANAGGRLLNKWGILDKISAATCDNKIVWESIIGEVSLRILPVPFHIMILNESVESCWTTVSQY